MKNTDSPTSRFVLTFLNRVDALHIDGIPDALQWASRLILHKQSSQREYEIFCSEFLEVILARTESWSDEAVKRANSILHEAGCFTLSALRRKNNKKLLRILKNGRIRSESELHIAKSALDDYADSLSADMLSGLDNLISEFEKHTLR